MMTLGHSMAHYNREASGPWMELKSVESCVSEFNAHWPLVMVLCNNWLAPLTAEVDLDGKAQNILVIT